jgi:NADH-quinone oxidoreductase subunit L
MVHIYAAPYMHGDDGVPRFMCFLSLFTFFMLMLVGADDLLQMFFGWEGVGLSSYLLIGFWVKKASANEASLKAFLVNRVGDFGFMLGLFGTYEVFGTLDFSVISNNITQYGEATYDFAGYPLPVLSVLAALFLIGAMAKSAQLGLHVWLPDAMEGPTPVSALIHAATMVTAGVFMLARLSPLFEAAPYVLNFVAMLGAVGAVFAASIALTQFDIKRVIAYSTMSQLGYMFFAVGVSAYGAAMFHLVTHAFFKSLLFLAAGSVIHALEGEQDMRCMGGLWRKLPYSYALMWIGSLALAGIGIEGFFGFAGFYSKEMILHAAYAKGDMIGFIAYGLGVLAAFMTGFYSWRLLVLTFHGEPRGEAKTHKKAHESSWQMLGPLVPLALGAVFMGAVGHDVFASLPDGDFWQGTIFTAPRIGNVAPHVPVWVGWLPLGLALLGAGTASWLYLKRPDVPPRIAKRLGPVHHVVKNQYYIGDIYDAIFLGGLKRFAFMMRRKRAAFDTIYDFVFVRVIQRLGRWLWQEGDDALIDRFGADGVAAVTRVIGRYVQKIHTGYISHYAFMFVAGLLLCVFWALR